MFLHNTHTLFLKTLENLILLIEKKGWEAGKKMVLTYSNCC